MTNLHLCPYLNKLLINIFTLFTFIITGTYSNETLAKDPNFMDVRFVRYTGIAELWTQQLDAGLWTLDCGR